MPVRSLATALVAVSALSVVAAAAAAPGGARTKAGPCVAASQDRITCGSGPGALVVLDGTTSRGTPARRRPTTSTRRVTWSPDSRWLLVGDGGKWALEAIAVYAVDEGAGAVKGLGLFRAISTAAARVLRERVGASKAGAYTLDIAGDQKIELANTGAASLPMLFQIPKEDKDIDLLVRFKASRNGDRVTTTPIDVSVVKR